MNKSIVIIVILIIAIFILPIWIGRWRATRAAKQVLDIFIDHGAIGPNKARTLQEMGLQRRGLLNLSLTRDYRQMALAGLMRGGNIEQTEDGKFYLTQEAYNAYLASDSKLSTRR